MTKHISGVLRTPMLACAWAVVIGGASVRGAEAQVASGNLTIPARGLFSLKEGTVEAWVKLNYDPAEPVEGFNSRGQLFLMRVPKAENDLGAELSIFFGSVRSNQKGDNNRSFTFLRAGFAIDGQEVPHPIPVELVGWKRDEWHHVAVAWQDGRHLAVYFDGKEVVVRSEKAEVTYPISTERDLPASAQIIVGSPYDRSPSALTIDEFRLSSVARRPGMPGFGAGPLQPDPFTMLLENFDNARPAAAGAGFETTPLVVADEAQPKAHRISDGVLVPGKFGKALQVSRPVPAPPATPG